MILMPDLFSFAYVPNWYSQLDMLAEMALPEPWRFKNPIYLTKNPDTPILERYIHAIFKKQLIDYKDERNPSSAADYFHIENEVGEGKQIWHEYHISFLHLFCNASTIFICTCIFISSSM